MKRALITLFLIFAATVVPAHAAMAGNAWY